MPSTIILSVIEGALQGERFLFRGPTRVLVGRAGGCELRLPSNDRHATVSRLHCQIEVRPPRVTICDVGSRNGTYVNGEKIGQRPDWQRPEDAVGAPWPARGLRDGDRVQVGETIFQVEVREPAPGAEQATEVLYDELAAVG
jgi:pSer/pThr/pTyr-binding forkhead associated (FHA) protein